MIRFISIYQRFLTRFPYGIQSFQTGILMAAGDQLAQNLVEERTFNNLDYKRTLKFATIGFILGPGLRACYGILDKYFGNKGAVGVMKKVACDQLIFAPTIIFLLLSGVGITQGKNYKEIQSKLMQEYPEILINNYKLWPMVQLINFSIVPLQYQVLVVQSVALLWNTYVSYTTNKNEHKQTH